MYMIVDPMLNCYLGIDLYVRSTSTKTKTIVYAYFVLNNKLQISLKGLILRFMGLNEECFEVLVQN